MNCQCKIETSYKWRHSRCPPQPKGNNNAEHFLTTSKQCTHSLKLVGSVVFVLTGSLCCCVVGKMFLCQMCSAVKKNFLLGTIKFKSNIWLWQYEYESAQVKLKKKKHVTSNWQQTCATHSHTWGFFFFYQQLIMSFTWKFNILMLLEEYKSHSLTSVKTVS